MLQRLWSMFVARVVYVLALVDDTVVDVTAHVVDLIAPVVVVRSACGLC